MDLIVRNARRRHRADLVDIGIAEGGVRELLAAGVNVAYA
jgi:hypothetical protein